MAQREQQSQQITPYPDPNERTLYLVRENVGSWSKPLEQLLQAEEGEDDEEEEEGGQEAQQEGEEAVDAFIKDDLDLEEEDSKDTQLVQELKSQLEQG